jgi:PERQ amino acid-rich with GYF domain-containing protein
MASYPDVCLGVIQSLGFNARINSIGRTQRNSETDFTLPRRTRRANGAGSNSTTRRPSLSTTLTHNNSTSSTAPLTSSASNVYHPPHHYNRQSAAASTTYGKEELLNLFKVQESGGSLSGKIAELVDTDFGAGANSGGWGRSGDEATNGLDMCWEKEGGLKPISLEEMGEEEREVGPPLTPGLRRGLFC